MNRLSFIRLIVLSCVCIAATEFRSSAAPLITAVDPETGPAGTELDIVGAEFTGLNRILFTERSSGAHADSPFSVVSDTRVLTTVPSRVGSRWLISMFSPLGATVTIPTGFFDITSTTFGNQASAVYLVRNGGVLTTGAGSSTIFVESGGNCAGAGGGNLTVYVQQGGTYMHGNGANSLIFYEPGATILAGGGSGNIFTEVLAVRPSFVPVPEPSVVGLFVFGVAWATLLRRRNVATVATHAKA
jgi:hypothetical protein